LPTFIDVTDVVVPVVSKSFLEETKKAALKLPPWTPIYGPVMQPMGAGALESEPFGPSISWKQR
jgi:hypothetical protein